MESLGLGHGSISQLVPLTMAGVSDIADAMALVGRIIHLPERARVRRIRALLTVPETYLSVGLLSFWHGFPFWPSRIGTFIQQAALLAEEIVSLPMFLVRLAPETGHGVRSRPNLPEATWFWGMPRTPRPC